MDRKNDSFINLLYTIINPDSVYELGIKAEADDEFITMYGVGGEHYSYRKNINSVNIRKKLSRRCKYRFWIN